jgi:hypothetical protein
LAEGGVVVPYQGRAEDWNQLRLMEKNRGQSTNLDKLVIWRLESARWHEGFGSNMQARSIM